MVDVFYKGSTGQIIDFKSENFKMLKDTDILSHKWSYSNNEYVAKIDSFSMEFVSKQFDVAVMNRTRSEYEVALRKINDVFDYDVRMLSPGRLYVGDHYLRCYIIECGLGRFDRHRNKVIKPYTLVAENGQWIKESFYVFNNSNTVDTRSYEDALCYPHDYPFDFASSIENITQVENGSIVGADLMIRIYGGCTNPAVTIGGHVYEVDCDVMTGEVLEINSVTKKCVKTKVNGEKISCFNFRNRESYIYQQVKPGVNTVIRSGTFNIDITIFEYRSEPEWWI